MGGTMSVNAGRHLDDSPPDSPLFDFPLIGDALAAVLTQAGKGATVVGIHGPWGSGKTTLMLAVKAALEKSAEPRPVVVEFNAWKYQAREALWRALILRLVGALREEGALSEEGMAKLESLEDSLYRAFEVQEAGSLSINWRNAATEIVSVVFEIFQLGFVGRLLRGIFGRRPRDEALLGEKDVERISGLLERETITRRVAQVQSIEQFLGAFRELIAELRAGGRSVVVLVDDLDRCLPESALEVFEAIKLFLDAPGCGFVVAVDREVIRSGLQVRYGLDGDSAATIDPDAYLEKAIGLSYDVPRLSGEDLGSLVREADLPFELADHQVDAIAMALDHNPRRVKRFLNVVRVQVVLAAAVAEQGRRVPPSLRPDGERGDLGVLIKTVLIGYRYPFLLSGGNPELIFDLEGIANSLGASGSSPEERRDELRRRMQGFTAPVRALKDRPEFWALLREQPGLRANPDEVVEVLNWFRRSGFDDSAAAADPDLGSGG